MWGFGGQEEVVEKEGNATTTKSKDIRLGAKHIGAVVDEWYVRVDEMKFTRKKSSLCTIM